MPEKWWIVVTVAAAIYNLIWGFLYKNTRDSDKDEEYWIASLLQSLAAGWLGGAAIGIIFMLKLK